MLMKGAGRDCTSLFSILINLSFQIHSGLLWNVNSRVKLLFVLKPVNASYPAPFSSVLNVGIALIFLVHSTSFAKPINVCCRLAGQKLGGLFHYDKMNGSSKCKCSVYSISEL